jgi:hypothetical protein
MLLKRDEFQPRDGKPDRNYPRVQNRRGNGDKRKQRAAVLMRRFR